jgi:hypothetical protein
MALGVDREGDLAQCRLRPDGEQEQHDRAHHGDGQGERAQDLDREDAGDGEQRYFRHRDDARDDERPPDDPPEPEPPPMRSEIRTDVVQGRIERAG